MRIVAIGEGMLELSATPGSTRLFYGGDSLNTAVYLARLGNNVAFLSALGADPLSANMRAELANEGIDLSLLATDPDRLPGLYAVHNDSDGERSFLYWRNESAARHLFSSAGFDSLLADAAAADTWYLSGITLSLFNDGGRRKLKDAAAAFVARGGEIAFDPNYRPTLWEARDEARRAIEHFASVVTIALPTLDDEIALRGAATKEDTIANWVAWGAREVAVKLGAEGVAIGDAKGIYAVEAVKPDQIRDTTGAGDSFNAAYLDTRWRGRPPIEAAQRGVQLAAAVIAYAGAVIPRMAMPF